MMGMCDECREDRVIFPKNVGGKIRYLCYICMKHDPEEEAKVKAREVAEEGWEEPVSVEEVEGGEKGDGGVSQTGGKEQAGRGDGGGNGGGPSPRANKRSPLKMLMCGLRGGEQAAEGAGVGDAKGAGGEKPVEKGEHVAKG